MSSMKMEKGYYLVSYHDGNVFGQTTYNASGEDEADDVLDRVTLYISEWGNRPVKEIVIIAVSKLA